MRSHNGGALLPTATGAVGGSRSQSGAGQRRVVRVAGTAITAMLAGTLAPWAATPAFAAVPVAPANIVIFPNRDFVGLEGYENRAGETVTIRVTRGTTVTGSAQGQFNSVGDLEVNHPGGVCWGTDPGPVAAPATPDIMAGDVVTAIFDDGSSDSATTQSPVVTSAERPVATPNRVVVLGTLSTPGGPVANTAQMEQRIVEPALLTTEVRKRDVRAPGGNPAVTSDIQFAGNNFTATYTFATPSTAAIALGGGMRAMTWEAEDADANRQGLTIAEFGEVGGPGMGECPAATPGATTPRAPGMGTAAVGNAAALVRWVRPIAGSSAITGYSIQVLNAGGAQVRLVAVSESGAASGARSAWVTGLTNGQAYHFQVRATNATAGAGPFSAPSNVVTPSTVPGAPGFMTALSGNAGGPVNAVARWTTPKTNGGASINGFVVTALRMSSTGSILSQTKATASPAARSLWMPLSRGTYRFMVQARNVRGHSTPTARSNAVIAQ